MAAILRKGKTKFRIMCGEYCCYSPKNPFPYRLYSWLFCNIFSRLCGHKAWKAQVQALPLSHAGKKQYLAELSGETPQGKKAMTPEQQRIQELEKQLWRAKRNNEILKKATALFIRESTNLK